MRHKTQTQPATLSVQMQISICEETPDIGKKEKGIKKSQHKKGRPLTVWSVPLLPWLQNSRRNNIEPKNSSIVSLLCTAVDENKVQPVVNKTQ